jgi:hypothetical protein
MSRNQERGVRHLFEKGWHSLYQAIMGLSRFKTPDGTDDGSPFETPCLAEVSGPPGEPLGLDPIVDKGHFFRRHMPLFH